jgi:cell division protein ZapA (FtsZ GTPase activity inhibitor)
VPSGLVEISVGGLSYRLKSDTEPNKLLRLAALVDKHVAECNPRNKLTPTQALLYAALTLAEELEQERDNNLSFETQARDSLQHMLHRIDAAIDATEPFFVSSSEPTRSIVTA